MDKVVQCAFVSRGEAPAELPKVLKERAARQAAEWTAKRSQRLSAMFESRQSLQALSCAAAFALNSLHPTVMAETLSLALQLFHRLATPTNTEDPLSVGGLFLMCCVLAGKQRGSSCLGLLDVAHFLCAQMGAEAAEFFKLCTQEADFFPRLVRPLRQQGRATVDEAGDFCWGTAHALPRDIRAALHAPRHDNAPTFLRPHYVVAMLADWEVFLLMRLEYRLIQVTPFDAVLAQGGGAALLRYALQQQLLGDMPYHEDVLVWAKEKKNSDLSDRAGCMIWNMVNKELK